MRKAAYLAVHLAVYWAVATAVLKVAEWVGKRVAVMVETMASD